jgi:tRNA (guanine26-N2/guanine27-N2)-dimethyltransferase
MSVNRDLAILFASSFFSSSKKIRLCDPMTGSGVRAARYLLETRNVEHVIAADRDEAAVNLARQTILLNGLRDRVDVIQDEAYTVLSNHTTDRFDSIDLDPFGSPAPFFESALRATSDGGVIAATATDMGPLSGARPTACLRKYGVSPVRAEFEKELALRTLASCLSTTACKLELGVTIAFAHATDHYARLYALVHKGRKLANQTLEKLGYMAYCPNCLSRNETKSISVIQNKCSNCGSSAHVGGPFWLGPIWDKETVNSMVQRTPALVSSRISDVQKILGRVFEETDAPRFYYTTEAIASAYRLKPPSLDSLIHSLRVGGYKATRTHFSSTGFRTDASLQAIVACFRTVADESQA